jgi:hypothetical protein
MMTDGTTVVPREGFSVEEFPLSAIAWPVK